MSTRTLPLPEDALVNMLKALPESALVDVFWKTLPQSDVSPLTQEEMEDIKRCKGDFEKGETIKWENLR